MVPVIKKYYKIDPSRIIRSDDKVDYIFRVDKDTGYGLLDISELSIFENSNLMPMLEKTRIPLDRKIYLHPKREGNINEIFLFKITELRLGEYELF